MKSETQISQIRKRDGRIVPFDPKKIERAIEKAILATANDKTKASHLTALVVNAVKERFGATFPSVEDIQDIVEEVLIREGYGQVAKAYILYRQKRTEARESKALLGVKDDLKLALNSLKVLQRRYLLRNEKGAIIETPSQLFRRVARAVTQADLHYEGETQAQKLEEKFYRMMTNLEFLPNSPCLMNSGTDLGQLSACFTPKQMIITKNGPKCISEIKVGELALTHKGRFRRVEKVFVREANSVYTINVYKLPTQTLKVTGEHPIFAVKKENKGASGEWIKVEDLEAGDYVALAFPQEIVDSGMVKVADFIRDKSVIQKNGYLVEKNEDVRAYVRKDGSVYLQNRNRSGEISKQTSPVKNEIVLDNDLMRLFGYYLSEGCISKNKRCLRFTFSYREKNYTQDVLKIAKKKFGISSRIEETNSADRKWLSIRFHSKILAEFFENLFGTGYDTKTIPDWVLLLPPDKQKGLLSGMFRGDSTVFKNGNNFSTRLVMCNPNLVYSAWQMLMRLGIFAGLNFESMPKLGRVLPVRCQVSGVAGNQLMSELLKKEISHNSKEYVRPILRDDILFTPIVKIEKCSYRGEVYNLEVEEDHSYCANMVAVHNCFVLPVGDSLKDIFEAVKHMTLIQQSGGGTGFDFSKLRPKGDVVRSTHGIASGPVSFMRVFDEATDVVKQGGRRRGANMGILRVDHPDIVEFIRAKEKEGFLTNFNLSVAVTDEFMEKVEKDEEYELVNPRDGEVTGKLPAKWVFDLIATSAWRTGDPGLVFIDEINRANPTPQLGKIESTNPCGELPLLAYEPCNLGSISLSKMVKNGEIDWEHLKKTVRLAVHFLDNVIDASKFPLLEIDKMAKGNRKIGLGVMGFADLLVELGIPYNSPEALGLAEKIMGFIEEEARKKSQELGEARGPFPNFKGSIWEKKGYQTMRNATVTTVAPTGTISIIANCSSGIEPIFALSFIRQVMEGTQLLEVNPVFEKAARQKSFYSKESVLKIAQSGSIQNLKEIPEDARRVFVTALDIDPEWHVRMQAAFQKHVENAVSKTVNLPKESTPEDVKKIYWLAYRLKCKGITIYRYGSKKEQVLYLTPPEKRVLGVEAVRAESEFAGGCPGVECTY